jgi:hypothetical protein
MLGLLPAVAAIVGGIVMIVRSRGLNGRATGVVVRDRGDFPVFRFTVPGRGEFEVRSRFGHSGSGPSAGTAVDVIYDPDNPRRARIDHWSYRGPFTGAVFIVLGVLLLAGWIAFR